MSAPAIERPTGWIGLEQLMTAAEVASVLRCSEKVVSNLRRAGRLPGVLVGRTHHYAPENVRDFIRSGGGGDAE